MKCLETDFLVATLRGKKEAERIVKELDEEGKGATTAINSFELFFGANRSERKNENVKQTSKLLERLIVFPLDFASSRKAADISAKLAAEGEKIDFRDAMIAAIAIENGLTLVSRNEAHFKRVKGLKLEVW
ncbi:MAG: type II toxin-antitoxin system VapC family toxin [Candidatus Bathyarchaeia archaeon]|jgi:predicted nucleic acid-binding protein